jgi:hypothetical protein
MWHNAGLIAHLDRQQCQLQGPAYDTTIKVGLIATRSTCSVLLSDLAAPEQDDFDSCVGGHHYSASLTT